MKWTVLKINYCALPSSIPKNRISRSKFLCIFKIIYRTIAPSRKGVSLPQGMYEYFFFLYLPPRAFLVQFFQLFFFYLRSHYFPALLGMSRTQTHFSLAALSLNFTVREIGLSDMYKRARQGFCLWDYEGSLKQECASPSIPFLLLLGPLEPVYSSDLSLLHNVWQEHITPGRGFQCKHQL